MTVKFAFVGGVFFLVDVIFGVPCLMLMEAKLEYTSNTGRLL